MQGMVGGFALHEALWLRVAGVSEPHVVQFPRLVSECEGCDDQGADRRGEKRGRWAASGKVVCVLGAPASVVACCSHVNPLLRAVTRYVVRKPAILSVGGAAQVRISGPTCASKGADVHQRGRCRYSVPIRVGRARNSALRIARRNRPDRDGRR